MRWQHKQHAGAGKEKESTGPWSTANGDGVGVGRTMGLRGEQAGVPALKGGEGRCPFPTGRHRALRTPAAARHTRWYWPPIGLVIDRRSAEGGLVLVAEAQDQGTDPTPAYTIAAVSDLPTAQPPCASPLFRPPLPPALAPAC